MAVPIKGLLLDMDGLLTDTEPLHMKGYIEALKPHGIELTEAEYADHWIVKGKGIAQFLEKIGSDLSPDRIRAEKAVIYEALVDNELRPMPGAVAFVRYFHGKVPLAVASASFRKNVLAALDGTGILPYLDSVISVDEVKRSKPAPDIFLKAAESLALEPRYCLVVEDADKGVIAAHNGGMRSIAVPNRFTADNPFRYAEAVFPTLAEAIPWIEQRLQTAS